MVPLLHTLSPTVLSLLLQFSSSRTKTVEAARADGEKIRLIGAAEARATEAVGRCDFRQITACYIMVNITRYFCIVPYTLQNVYISQFRAEAERMRMKASAYKQYGDAAILSLVLEALPQIAAEVSRSRNLEPSLNSKACHV